MANIHLFTYGRIFTYSNLLLFLLVLRSTEAKVCYAQRLEHEHSHVEEDSQLDSAKKQKLSRLFDLDKKF